MRAPLIAVASLIISSLFGSALADPPAATAQVQAFSIGKLQAFALKDGSLEEPVDGKSFTVGQSPAAIGAVLKSGGASPDKFQFSIQPLLVKSGSRVLLFDTGAGGNFGPIAGALPKSMQSAGVDPASVTDIFISHAHGDHIGGLLTSSGALAFPNATIHISAPEWTYLNGLSSGLAEKMGLSHVDALVKTLKPKVEPFTPGAELIPGVVKAVEIKGHTPGHSGYLIGSGTNSLLYIGDSLHSYVVSLRKPEWHTAFDADPDLAADSRVALVARVAASGQRVYAVHFPFPGIGRIVKQDAGYTWVPDTLH